MVGQLSMKDGSLYEIQRFTAVFTTARYWFLKSVRGIQSSSSSSFFSTSALEVCFGFPHDTCPFESSLQRPVTFNILFNAVLPSTPSSSKLPRSINKVIYSVLAQHQYILINTLVLATCFGFYQPSSGLCLLYGGTFSVHIHYGIPWCLHKIITLIKV